MGFTDLRSKAVSHRFVTNNMSHMRTTHQWEIQNSMLRTPVNCFFPDFLRAQNMVRVIEGKIIINDLRENKN